MSQSKMAGGDKSFVIKHVFSAVQKIPRDRKVYGPEENHFGFSWRLRLHWDENYINFLTLQCRKLVDNASDAWNGGEWTVKANITMDTPKIAGKNEAKVFEFNQGKQEITFSDILWKDLKDVHIKNGNLTVQCHVTIDGKFEKNKLRNFDESMKEFSDVVLVVGGEKFYVLKKFLAAHSIYFKSLFSENFSESEKSEIGLKKLEPEHFQNFLELIYGDSLIADDSVEGILNLADFLDSKTAFKRCEEFLASRSELSLKTKFHAAIKYQLNELKKKCMSEMKTKEDVKSVMPEDHSQFDTSVWAELLEKAVSF